MYIQNLRILRKTFRVSLVSGVEFETSSCTTVLLHLPDVLCNGSNNVTNTIVVVLVITAIKLIQQHMTIKEQHLLAYPLLKD